MTKPEKKLSPNLPLQAKRVFKGVIFEVWQWEQKMFDGTVELFEKIKRPNTAEVIPIVGDKILIQAQQQPDTGEFLSLPGGRCEKEEDLLVAAKRELLEETGYESDDWVLWKKDNHGGKIIWTMGTYIARDCRKIQEPRLDAGEKIKNKLITFDEFLILSDNPSFRANKEIIIELLRCRIDQGRRRKLRKEIYG